LDKFYLKCGFTEEYEKYTIYHYSREKLQWKTSQFTK
jgi:hypothetical protein